MTVAIQIVNGRFGSYKLSEEPLKVPGSARIYRVAGRQDILYKEFARPLAGPEEMSRIEELVSAGNEFGVADLSSSRGRIAWPKDAVILGDEVVGVAIPYAGDQFYNPPIRKRLLPRHLTYLRTPEEGVSVELRLRLMRQLAGVMALLHHVDLVHGDVAAQNILWTLSPRPSIFLIDCDGMHSDAVEGGGGSTDGWADPRKEEEVIASQDMRSDWFALALAIWRVTTLSTGTPEHGPGGVILPPKTPRPFRGLLVRTFEDVMNADRRPAPEEWVEALDEVLGSKQGQRSLQRLVPPQRTPPRGLRTSKQSAPRPAPSAPPPTAPRRRRSLLRTLAVVAILACVAVVGVSFFDTGPSAAQVRAEKAVARWSRSVLHAGRVTVECPGDSSLHAGARYRCRVETRGGAVARVPVRVRRRGRVHREINLFAFRRRAITRDLYSDYRLLRRHGLDRALKRVSCPQTISVNAGTRFQCAATFTDGAKGNIVGNMAPQLGYFSWREEGTKVVGFDDALH